MSQVTGTKLDDGTEKPTSPFDEIKSADFSEDCYRDFPFSSGEEVSHFKLARRFSNSYYRKLEDTRQRAREFCDKHIRPRAIEIEKKVSRDPLYFDWELMREACKYRFFSMLVPESFDGMGCSALHMATMVEELAVGCAGVASTIGVHSAGISCAMVNMDLGLFEKHIRPIGLQELQGEPELWGGAVTEPNAGTDIWDEDFLDIARIMTIAKKVPGGYRLTGRKCFISNGSVAHKIVVAAALDPKNILESWTGFLVPTDSPGFSVGRVEKKMGQKAGPASELIMEDVFIPDELRLGDEGTAARFITIYLAGSRGPVGAIGTGCARRSLECLIDWAKQKKNKRGRLIDQQALQLVQSSILDHLNDLPPILIKHEDNRHTHIHTHINAYTQIHSNNNNVSLHFHSVSFLC